MDNNLKNLLETDVDAIVAEGQANFKKARRKAITCILVFLVLCAIGAGAYVVVQQVRLHLDYQEAVSLLDAGEYEEAASHFKLLGDYKDSEKLTEEAHTGVKYLYALARLEEQDYEGAYKLFKKLDDYKDSRQQASTAQELLYDSAIQMMEEESFIKARQIFDFLGDFKDSKELREEAKERQEKALEQQCDTNTYIGNWAFLSGDSQMIFPKWREALNLFIEDASSKDKVKINLYAYDDAGKTGKVGFESMAKFESPEFVYEARTSIPMTGQYRYTLSLTDEGNLKISNDNGASCEYVKIQ